ncbi:DNA-binding transcriptional regulator, AcrR family [Sinosporangium album]|uniref:DNA-binding transcriptional regulator, AcrR family n=1 Tax=Sinosporangium album TaxID=504805 RepID=A0A1G8BPS8_9ACTN|nr:TetR/AcrR family transcriptional regulator [Sinosporangium album]SDH35153.1 DNA-binding transcriptional regulator, AcrR family [Sinosporangium album]
MTSIHHNKRGGAAGRIDIDAVLDAARECVLAVGVRRTTLTDVAKRAEVSRMTLYRTWPDISALVASLMTREWVRVTGEAVTNDPVESVVAGVRALRAHPLWRKIVEVDPELLLPYLLRRRGGSHDAMLALIEAAVEAGQRGGTVRQGDPTTLARAVLLTAQSFALSAGTMLGPTTVEELDAELTELLRRYLST